jgi:phospholipid/cholesterol/gamma-HCH transport system permease protein
MRKLLKMLDGAGYTTLLLVRAVGFMFRRPRVRMTVQLMYGYGLKSLPVVAVVALFSGMIITLQTGLEMRRFGQLDLLGAIVAQTFAREFGPFMTAIILVGTVVSAYTAEIGTMKVSEETDALEVMSIDPIGFLAAPRILALTLMTFLLALCADVVGVVGGAIVAHTQLGEPAVRFLRRALDTLRGTQWFGLPRDLYSGLLKAMLTGFLISGVGCACGLRASGGALGVGRSVRNAVINCIVLILVVSYVFTWATYSAFQ